MLKDKNQWLVWLTVLVFFGIMIASPAGAAIGAGNESGQNGNSGPSGSVDSGNNGNTDPGGPNPDGQNLNENDYDYNYDHDYDCSTDSDVNHDYNYSHDYDYDYDYDYDRGPGACLYNGEPLTFDVEPIVIDNRTLVELRGLYEAFGGQLNWDQAQQQANGSLNGNVLQVRLYNRIALVNGQEVEMDVPAVVMNGRIMVPLRFMAENFGKEVRWEEASGTAFIDDIADAEAVMETADA